MKLPRARQFDWGRIGVVYTANIGPVEYAVDYDTYADGDRHFYISLGRRAVSIFWRAK